ncbi:hypothetical protein QBC35DRAFT_251150 [Podospora australis]|uniref:C2H2-type domain-containing protein n=1 Tax=Podospora australis TaxID=1536484 RepID=A0AAN6WTA2_9PEZI|nr:hypothetical protein QBC35DRAFT_251150 [Podospora australis]
MADDDLQPVLISQLVCDIQETTAISKPENFDDWLPWESTYLGNTSYRHQLLEARKSEVDYRLTYPLSRYQQASSEFLYLQKPAFRPETLFEVKPRYCYRSCPDCRHHLYVYKQQRKLRFRRPTPEEQQKELKRKLQLLLETLELWLWVKSVCYSKLLETVFQFPRGMRHLCTTMPWTIWPVLVVLWGVCWMFYPPCGTPNYYDVAGIPVEYHEEFLWLQEVTLLANDADDLQPADPLSHVDFGSVLAEYSGIIEAPSELGHILDPGNRLSLLGEMPSRAAPPLECSEPPQEHSGSGLPQPGSGSCNLPPLGYPIQVQAPGPAAAALRERPAERLPTPSSDSSPDQHRISCPECSQKFSKLSSLERHQLHMHNEIPQEFPCPHEECTRKGKRSVFKRKDGLERHLRNCRYHQAKGTPPSSSRATSGNPQSLLSSDHSGLDLFREEPAIVEQRKRKDRNEDDCGDDLLIKGLRKKLREKNEEVERVTKERDALAETLRILEETSNT